MLSVPNEPQGLAYGDLPQVLDQGGRVCHGKEKGRNPHDFDNFAALKPPISYPLTAKKKTAILDLFKPYFW